MRILIVGDHPILRNILGEKISQEPDIEVVGEANNEMEAVQLYAQQLPDLVLMNIPMLGENSIQVAAHIIASFPEAKILAFSAFAGGRPARDLIAVGVSGYITKIASSEEMSRAIREVARNSVYLPLNLYPLVAFQASRKNNTFSKLPILSGRENQILDLMADYLSDEDIAERLEISASTVRVHIHHIIKKLKLERRMNAVLYAIRLREEREKSLTNRRNKKS